MHAHETVQLAALVATCGRRVLKDRLRISANSLNNYFVASKCRINRWTEALGTFDRAVRDGTIPACRDGQIRLAPVLQEIFSAEALLRVWTAIITAYDRRQRQQEDEPLVRSVYVGHQDVRNRAMRHLLGRSLPDKPQPGSTPEIVALEQCRRRTERWTDLLLGYLLLEHDVTEFAFDADRACGFGRDIGREECAGEGHLAWSLTLRSLQTAFRDRTAWTSPNPDLNERIAVSVLACFPPEMFESIGALTSLWTLRIVTTTDDAAAMIDDLLRVG